MAHQEFKIGDVVRLRSGGPSMTVVNPAASGGKEVWCEYWNEGTSKFENRGFYPALLEPDE